MLRILSIYFARQGLSKGASRSTLLRLTLASTVGLLGRDVCSLFVFAGRSVTPIYSRGVKNAWDEASPNILVFREDT